MSLLLDSIQVHKDSYLRVVDNPASHTRISKGSLMIGDGARNRNVDLAGPP